MLYKFKTFLKSNKFGRAIYEPIGYIYRKYYKDPQRLRQMKKYGYDSLRYIMEISEKEGWDVMPIFGTLLGFIREGDFIKHDNDIDLVVAPGHDPKQMAQILVEKYGLKFDQALSYHGQVTEFSVEHHGISIDFFFFEEEGNKTRVSAYFWNSNEPYTDARQNNVQFVYHPKIEAFKYIDIKGISVKVPTNSEEFLYCEYGKGWNIPDPNYVDNDRPGKVLVKDYGYSHTYEEFINNKIRR